MIPQYLKQPTPWESSPMLEGLRRPINAIPREKRAEVFYNRWRSAGEAELAEIETDEMALDVIAAREQADAALARINQAQRNLAAPVPTMPTQPTLTAGEGIAALLGGAATGDFGGAVNTGLSIANSRQTRQFDNDMRAYEAAQLNESRNLELALKDLGYSRDQIETAQAAIRQANAANVQDRNQQMRFDAQMAYQVGRDQVGDQQWQQSFEANREDQLFSRGMQQADLRLRERGFDLQKLMNEHGIDLDNRQFGLAMATFAWQKMQADREFGETKRMNDAQIEQIRAQTNRIGTLAKLDMIEATMGLSGSLASLKDQTVAEEIKAIEDNLPGLRKDRQRLESEVRKYRTLKENARSSADARSYEKKEVEAQVELQQVYDLLRASQAEINRLRGGSQQGGIRPVNPLSQSVVPNAFQLELPSGGSMTFED